MWYTQVLECFKIKKARANFRWSAFCPCHPDKHPSLSLWLGRNGCMLFACWAGCTKADILKEVGLKMGDMFPPAEGTGPYEARRIVRDTAVPVAYYDYHDEQGALLYQAVRMEPKSFRYRRPGKPGENLRWIWNLDGVRRVLFNLPKILASPDAPVIVCEGEKDACSVTALGHIGTTNCGGCGMGWHQDYSKVLRGRRVVVIPDNDLAGYKRADEIVGSCLRHGAASVRCVSLEVLPEHGDITDWLAMFEGQDQAAVFASLVKVYPRLGVVA